MALVKKREEVRHPRKPSSLEDGEPSGDRGSHLLQASDGHVFGHAEIKAVLAVFVVAVSAPFAGGETTDGFALSAKASPLAPGSGRKAEKRATQTIQEYRAAGRGCPAVGK